MGEPVELTGRARQIVQFLARADQATPKQLHELFFNDVSYTPLQRTLKRLTELKYLTRTEHQRVAGGAKGGSGQYAYSLGRRGYWMFYSGSHTPRRAVDYHAIAIVESYLIIKRLERAGKLQILGVSFEDEAHVKIGGDDVKPDMFLDVQRSDRQYWWFEVDMATEGPKRINEKLLRYWRAYNNSGREGWSIFPLVLWVAVDDERTKELRWLVSRLPAEAQALFRVTTLAGLGSVFGG